jgi:hypothetical protein
LILLVGRESGKLSLASLKGAVLTALLVITSVRSAEIPQNAGGVKSLATPHLSAPEPRLRLPSALLRPPCLGLLLSPAWSVVARLALPLWVGTCLIREELLQEVMLGSLGVVR